MQVVSKPHHTLVTLLLCNAVALEVPYKTCTKLLLGLLHIQLIPIRCEKNVCSVGSPYLLGQTG